MKIRCRTTRWQTFLARSRKRENSAWNKHFVEL